MFVMIELQPPYGYYDGYIHLAGVRFKGLPEVININDFRLRLKSELHISLICVKRIVPMINEERTDELQAEILEAFQSFITKTPLDTFKPSKVFRLVERDERKTVVMMVEVPHLKEFFEMLSSKYDKRLPVQPTHITLYTLQHEAGIGILTTEELERDSVQVEVEGLSDKRLIPIRA
jgi:hypothetical protein